MKKKKTKISISKVRLFISFVFFFSITCFLGYSCYSNFKDINNKKNEIKELNTQLVTVNERKEELENYVLKLKDPEYLANYIREKYMYSKNGELIFNLSE